AGIAAVASSHHSSTPPAAGASPSASSSAATSSPAASPTASASAPAAAGTPIAGGPWGAELIGRSSITQNSLVSAGGSLYAYGSGALERINPATGAVAASVKYSPPLLNLPVVIGNTVWVVFSYSG